MLTTSRPCRRRSWLRLVLSALAAVGLAVGGWFGLWQYRLSQGRSALSQRNAAEALRWLRAAERMHSRHGETHFLLARASRRLGDVQALRRHLELAHQSGFPAERLEREWILAQAQVGLLAQAEPHFRRLLLSPGDDGPEICAAFANGYVHHYRYQKAIEILESWQADYPDDHEPYLMRGKIRQKWRHWSEAEDEYREARRRAPRSLEIRRRLGEVLAAQHKYDQAVLEFQACLQEAPDDPELLAGWAECLMDLGRLEEAQAVFRRLVEQNGDDCSARHGLGQIALVAGRADEALQWLLPALEHCPRRTDIRYSLARALIASGRREEAKEHLARSERATEALIRVSNLSASLIRSPGDLETRFEIGRLVMEYGDPDEGRNWLATVLAVDPDHKPTHALLADFYAARGDDEQAEEHRQLACAAP